MIYLFQCSAVWLAFLTVVSAASLPAYCQNVDDGNKFLRKILPEWEAFCEWNAEECGKLSWKTVQNGKPNQYSESWSTKNHFLLSNSVDKSTEIEHEFRNPEYFAGIAVDSQTGLSNVRYLHKKGDAAWATQRIDNNRSAPIWSSSRYPDYFFPELIRDGHLVLIGYENSSENSGLHRLTFERTDDLRYGDLVLEFRDDILNMPVTSINNFGISGQRFTNSKFEKVGDFFLPTVVDCEAGIMDAPTKLNLIIKWDPSNSLDESKCRLEYYEIAKPEFDIANTKSKRTNVLAISIGVMALMGIVFFIWRNHA